MAGGAEPAALDRRQVPRTQLISRDRGAGAEQRARDRLLLAETEAVRGQTA